MKQGPVDSVAKLNRVGGESEDVGESADHPERGNGVPFNGVGPGGVGLKLLHVRGAVLTKQYLGLLIEKYLKRRPPVTFERRVILAKNVTSVAEMAPTEPEDPRVKILFVSQA